MLNFNFVPKWCWTPEEYNYISSKTTTYIDTYWEENIPRNQVYKSVYNEHKGADWPSYKEFLQGADPHPDVHTKEFKLDVVNYFVNRDKWHLNQLANQKLADNLYNQTK